MEDMGMIMAMAGAAIGVVLAIQFLVGGYFFAVWDSRKDGSTSKDDGQIGLKIVLFTIAIAGLGVAAGGVNTLLQYLLSGAKTGTPAIKGGLANLVSGGAIIGGVMLMFLPRTNVGEQPKVQRLALGYVAAIAGSVSVIFFSMFVSLMINGGGAPWVMKSAPLASFLTYGALAFLAINKLGGMSGWSSPVRPAMPQGGAGGGGYPPQGGYQQGGMPQQGGYPPQGGMPQQGGYPPQQGGYPPQQGGYPPQGGGGYPPQGGGGGYGQPR